MPIDELAIGDTIEILTEERARDIRASRELQNDLEQAHREAVTPGHEFNGASAKGTQVRRRSFREERIARARAKSEKRRIALALNSRTGMR